ADVRAGLDPVAGGDGKGVDAEAFGAYEGQVQGGQRRHRVGGHQAATVAGAVQHEPRQPVDGLVTGDHGAVMVGHEAGAPGAAGEVMDADQGAIGGGAKTGARVVVGGSP